MIKKVNFRKLISTLIICTILIVYTPVSGPDAYAAYEKPTSSHYAITGLTEPVIGETPSVAVSGVYVNPDSINVKCSITASGWKDISVRPIVDATEFQAGREYKFWARIACNRDWDCENDETRTVSINGKDAVITQVYFEPMRALIEVEYTFKLPGGPTFEDQTYFDIPESRVGTKISGRDYSMRPIGGTKPYTFSAVGLPAGITMTAEGMLSGTPTEVCPAGTATLTVTDSENLSASIEIAYGEVKAALITGECGEGVTYTFDSSNGLLTINGSGAIESRPWTEQGFADQIVNVQIGSGITTVWPLVISPMPNLESYTVESGNSKFQSQDGVLYTTRYSGGVKVLYEMAGYPQSKKDETYAIPDGVESALFYQDGGSSRVAASYSSNTYLKKIVIPASLTQMSTSEPANLEVYEVKEGNAAYKSADGVLFAIKSAESVKLISVPQYLKTENNEYTVPENTTEIGTYSFSGNKLLKKVTIPSSVTKLCMNAFEACEALEMVVIEDGLNTMEDSVFEDCKKLKAANIPSTVTTVGKRAFAGCSSLTDVTLAEGVKALNNGAFTGCSSLKTITLPSTLSSLYDSVFWGCISLESIELADAIRWIGSNCFRNCNSLKYFEIPEGATSLTELKDGVFWGSGLETITLPSFVKGLAWNTFKECTSLKKIDLSGTAVTSIGSSLFEGCNSLEEVILPDGMTSIGAAAFKNCDALETLLIPEGLTSMKEDSFTECDNLVLTVYRDSYGHTAAEEYGIPYTIVPPDSAGSCGDGVTYNFDGLTGLLTISGNGAISSTPWNDEGFTEQIRDIQIGSGITSVYCLNVYDMLNVRSYTVESGSNYFLSQDGVLYTIRYANGVKTFDELVAYPQAKKDETYVIPDDVQGTTWFYDGGRARTPVPFSKNAYLKKIVIPSSMKEMDTGRPKNLEEYEVKSGNVTYKSVDGVLFNIETEGTVRLISLPPCLKTVNNEYTVPSDTTEIYYSACGANKLLKKVTIPSTVTRLYQNAFAGCIALETVVMQEGIRTMEEYAFKNCKSLKSVVIPGSIGSVGVSAFFGCESLTDVTLSEGVVAIKVNAFTNCSSLKEIDFPDSLEHIGYLAFAGCKSLEYVTLPEAMSWLDFGAFRGCTSLKSFIIPETATELTEIGYECFAGSGLESITLPSSIDDLNWEVFRDCTSLTSVDMSETAITYIGSNTFGGCSSLTEVKLPGGVETIATEAFKNCDALETLLIPESLTSMKEDSFAECDNLVLTVYRDSYGHTAAKEYGIPYVIFGAEDCPNVTGQITSWSASGVSKMELMQDGEVKYTADLSLPVESEGQTGVYVQDYLFDGVAPGTYTLTLTMGDQSTREYTVTVGNGNLMLELKLAVRGDVDLDGKVGAEDLTRLARHVAEIEFLTDAVALQNADVTGDGKAEAEDLTKLARYVAEIIDSLE